MQRFVSQFRIWMFPLFLLGVSLIAFGVSHQQSEAQGNGSIRIGSIAVNAWTSTTATIAFTVTGVPTNEDIEAQIQYGTSTQYGSTFPSTTYARLSPTSTITITGLQPSTTYHYRLRVRAVNETTVLDQSADRTFATKFGDNTASPTIIVQGTDCQQTSCLVSFTTALPATVTLAWDTTFQSPAGQSDFCTTYGHCAAETIGSFLSTGRQLQMTGLTGGTTYHYRLMATAQNGNWTMTGNTSADLQITTTNGGSDHTFTTGSCSESGSSFPIGSCLPSGMLCTPNGPKQDCTSSCGFTCASGSTCNASGLCLADPALTGAPTQCNQGSCYNVDGTFKNPAPAGCFITWSKCTANTILKVQRDRGCNVWLSCGTSIQTTPSKNLPAENLCLSLAGCNQIGPDGQCTRYLPPGQCDNDPLRFCANDADCTAGGTCNNPDPEDPTRNLRDLTYTTPSQVQSIANLSGNIVAGLDWATISGSTVIQGMLPWQLMRQIGGAIQIKNGDFETNVPSVAPWIAVPEGETADGMLQVGFEDASSSINHVMKVTPITQRTVVVTPAVGTTPAVEATVPVNKSGVASTEFTTSASEYYYAEARIRSEGGNPIVRFELGYDGFSKFTTTPTANGSGQTLATFVDVQATNAWQRVTIGPIKGLSGSTRVAAVCADTTTCAEFWVDDIQVRPVLQTSTNPTFVSPTCRLYPKENSPSCDYTDEAGIAYKGWRGYCLENDSQTGNCLSWWPVDIIKGESSIFGTEKAVGYQDRSPLYFCAQSSGSNGAQFESQPYTVYVNHSFGNTGGAGFTTQSLSSSGVENIVANCNPAGDGNNGCSSTNWGSSYSIAACSTAGSPSCQVPASNTQADGQLLESQISRVRWVKTTGTVGGDTGDIIFDNSSDFQASTSVNPWKTGIGDNESRIKYAMYRDTVSDPKYIYWRYQNTFCNGTGLNGNCVTALLKFDASTGKFLTYTLDVNDNTGNEAEQLSFQVVFTVKEMCQAVTQTVKSNGENVGFASRLNSNSYLVEGLNYKRNTDFLPFGALLPPADHSDDPTQWKALNFETQNKEFDSPGQARAGSSYACVGNCAGAICHAADPSNSIQGQSCTLPATSSNRCSIDTDSNSKADGICSGGVTSASARGPQSFSASQTTIVSGSTAADPFFAQNRLQRLFAKSYGVWSNRRCVNYAGGGVGQYTTTACVSDANCQGNGFTNAKCDFQTDSYELVANSQPDRIINASTFVGWSPPTSLCPVSTIAAPGQCSKQQLVCNANEVITGPKADSVQEAKDAARTSCRAKQACDGNIGACTTQGVSGTTVKYSDFNATSCVTTADKKVTCTGRCVATDVPYVQVVNTPSNAPAIEKRIRSAAPNDYCAIPPSFSNIKFSNAISATTVINGGGNVGITLNTNADADQVPLSTIIIDWGDGQTPIQYPYAPKSDPKTPHIFSHPYNYNRADTAHCAAGSSCIYQIKVQVKDNWGWCSEAGVKWCSNNTTKSCSTNGECGGGATCDYRKDGNGNVIQCESSSTKWVNSGLQVVVNP